ADARKSGGAKQERRTLLTIRRRARQFATASLRRCAGTQEALVSQDRREAKDSDNVSPDIPLQPLPCGSTRRVTVLTEGSAAVAMREMAKLARPERLTNALASADN